VDLPVVDLAAPGVAAAIDTACRDKGFFYVVGHGVDPALGERLEAESREFFALPEAEKAEIEMVRGGRAWRGWFPVGGELTDGIPDQKEGIYFGVEQPATHARPLHGPNLFPVRPAGMRPSVLDYIAAMRRLGARLLDLIGVAVDGDPVQLFRVFHYPPGDGGWGVGEHTDYGLLTILRQDATAGLQVRSPDGWIDAPPIPDSFVCNLGDMLERWSGGRYRSTAHRVRNAGAVGRLSFPYFFDPPWDADVGDGTYGDYLTAKVSRVFPALASFLRQ
jgi:isopenicillin N synthase-like dioxygenase